LAKLDLSLTAEQLEEYLNTQRTVRIATAAADGTPHVVPLWFIWLDGSMFVNTTLGNVTVENAEATGRATGGVDDGETYDTLRGVVLTSSIERADDDPRIPEVARRWSEKYLSGNPLPYKGWRNRVWLRLDPQRIASWDFRKIPEARARRDAARAKG
jgi:hypothetical protein